jgi:DNA-binding XRE family transcriptional regulator
MPIEDEQESPLTFADYMLRLWKRAGCPASRVVAAAVGMAHTTVHSVVKGDCRPKWTTAEPLLRHFGADMTLAFSLWENAAAADMPSMSVQARLDRIEDLLRERVDEARGEVNEVRVWLAREGYTVDKSRPLLVDVREALGRSPGNPPTDG